MLRILAPKEMRVPSTLKAQLCSAPPFFDFLPNMALSSPFSDPSVLIRWLTGCVGVSLFLPTQTAYSPLPVNQPQLYLIMTYFDMC